MLRRTWALGSTGSVYVGALIVAATATLVALIVSDHLSVPEALLVATSGFAAMVALLASVDRLADRRDPTRAEEAAAIARIRLQIESTLDRYSIDRPEIYPPVKLLDVPGEHNHPFGLESQWSTAATTSSTLLISQMAAQPRFTLVMGEPGSGKTSLLLRLTQRMLTDHSEGKSKLVPLFISCRQWTTEYHSLDDWISANARTIYRTPQRVSDHWMKHGQLVLALDGLDEVSDDRREDLMGAVNSWAQAAEGARIVLTSRTTAHKDESFIRWLQADQIAMLQPLDDSDIRTHLRRAIAEFSRRLRGPTELHAVRAMGEWIEGIITSDENLRGPALVGLLAESVRKAGQLPNATLHEGESRDPAEVAFRLANNFLAHGDVESAEQAYEATTHIVKSRWCAPAAVLLGTCLYIRGDRQGAHNAMLESVALRLREAVEPTDKESLADSLSDKERQVLNAMVSEASYDLSQVSSSAHLSTSQSRLALQKLKDKGLVEIIEGTRKRVRFRRSVAADKRARRADGRT